MRANDERHLQQAAAAADRLHELGDKKALVLGKRLSLLSAVEATQQRKNKEQQELDFWKNKGQQERQETSSAEQEEEEPEAEEARLEKPYGEEPSSPFERPWKQRKVDTAYPPQTQEKLQSYGRFSL